MSGDWPEYRVSELQKKQILLVEDGNHGEYRPRRDEFGTGTTRFIRASNMGEGRVKFDQADLISDIAFDRIRKGIGVGGDILFSHKGTVGKTALTPEDAPKFICSPQTTFWRSLNSDVLDQRFLYYCMKSWAFQSQWRSRKGETDMADYVSLTAQRALKLPLPQITIQRSISRILGTLDDKIELNREMNRTLEDTAQAIFRSWFVDFDPVVAKADGRKPFGMSDELAAHFPDRFVESDLGPIPEGWDVQSLEDLLVLDYGKSLPAKVRQRGVVPVFGSNGQIDTHTEPLTRGPGVIVGRKGSAGIVTWTETDFYPIDTTFYVVPVAHLGIRFLYFLLCELDLTALIGDSAVPGLSRSLAYSLRVTAPDEGLGLAFEKLVEPFQLMARRNQEESQTLAALRDLLLPKLLSGEIRVAEAESAVEAAL